MDELQDFNIFNETVCVDTIKVIIEKYNAHGEKFDVN